MSLLSFLCVVLKVTVMMSCFERILTLLWVQAAAAAPFDVSWSTEQHFCLHCLGFTLRLRLAGISGGHMWNLPAQPGPCTANCSGPCPEGFWLSQAIRVAHKLPGQPVPVLLRSHSKKAFPNVQMKPSRCAELGQSHSQRGQAAQNKTKLHGLS